MIDNHIYIVSKSKFAQVTSLVIKEGDKLNIKRASKKQVRSYEYIQFERRGAIDNAFIKVLGINRIWLTPDENVSLSMFVNTNGKIMELTYMIFNKNSKLTLKEINQLTFYIKEHVFFQIPPDQNVKLEPLLLPTPYSYLVKFRRLIEDK